MGLLFGFIVLYICVCQVGTIYEHINIRPFGTKMCEALCKSFEQCGCPLFVESSLTCYFWNPNTTLADRKCSRTITSRLERLVTVEVQEPCGQVIDSFNVSQVTDKQHRTIGGLTDKQQRSTGHNESSLAESKLTQGNHTINLHQACKEGNLEVVKHILSQGVEDINSRGTDGRTPVMEAALSNQLDVFNYLVDRGCNMSLLDNNKHNVLHFASYGGSIEIVKQIVNLANISFKRKNSKGWTPLFCAVEKGHRTVVDLFVSKHYNLKAVDTSGNTVLHVACRGGHLDMVKHILSLYMSGIDSTNVNGRTPVMCAIEKGHISVVDFLISKHCNLKALDRHTNTILHVACYGGHLDMVKHILSLNTTDIDRKASMSRTPVMCAAEKGHISVVDFLMSKHCNMHAQDMKKYLILHFACAGGHVDMVKHILSLNMYDIESPTDMDWTPVMVAAREGHTSVVKLLVSKHCNLTIIDFNHDTVLHLACYSGHVDLVTYILSLNVTNIESKGRLGRTPVMCAVKHGHKSVVEFLMSKHCNMKALDGHGNTIFHVACVDKHVDMVKYILSLNVTDIESKNKNGRTPVMYAILKSYHTLIVDLLLSKHCNMNAVDDHGNTVLHVACESGSPLKVKYILSLNVTDIESKTKTGKTPVMTAASTDSTGSVHFLEQYHCNLQAVDNYGQTILHYAVKNVWMVKYILSLNVIDIDRKGRYGRTPVMYAVEKGRKSVVDLLVSKHCNMAAVDDDGNNVIHLACSYGRRTLVKHILSLRVLTGREKNKQGQTPAQIKPSLWGKVPNECHV